MGYLKETRWKKHSVIISSVESELYRAVTLRDLWCVNLNLTILWRLFLQRMLHPDLDFFEA